MRNWFLAISVLLTFSFAAFAEPAAPLACKALPPEDSLSIAPQDGHNLFHDSIDQAKTSIDMMMYHLSDLETEKHLLAAQKRGVQIRIILDANALKSRTSTLIFNDLTASGISVQTSTPMFSITHVKAAVFDNSWALVTSINLTNTATYSRDFGIKTYDGDVVAEFESVFTTDLANAQNKTALTPELKVAKLLWSPVNSLDKILALINSATKSIYLEVENFGHSDVLAALEAKARAGISVVVVVPACVEGGGTRNLPFLKDLAAAGVDARLSMPPYSGQNPYIHAKAIVVDEQTFYVGSENFSYNSLILAREMGIVEANPTISAAIRSTIIQDAGLATPSAQVPADFACAANTIATPPPMAPAPAVPVTN